MSQAKSTGPLLQRHSLKFNPNYPNASCLDKSTADEWIVTFLADFIIWFFTNQIIWRKNSHKLFINRLFQKHAQLNKNICCPKLDIKHEKNYQDWNISRQRRGRYAVRSGKRTDIPDIRTPRYGFTMLERWLPRITARKLRSVVLRLLKVIGFIF